VALKRKFPLSVWFHKYQVWILKLYGKRRFRYAIPRLEKFFAFFPADADLKDFSITDVADYRVYRLDAGVNPASLDMELNAVRTFWKWLIEDQGLPLYQLADKYRTRFASRNRESLKLENFRLLLTTIDDPQVRDYVLGLAVGEERDVGIPMHKLSPMVRQAVIRAGMPWANLAAFRATIMRSLWRDIIRSNYDKLCNAFVAKPETPSDTLADIEVPATDERPPVSHYADYHALIGGIQ
jgi:hypothetical protein